MATYKTPGVYIEEVSLFPPSVAEVETAIPAFIGYTSKAEKKGKDLTNVPTKISSLLEYKEYFGEGPDITSISVTLDGSNNPSSVAITPNYYLFHSLRLFFDNGGGDCYIVSIGTYDSTGAVVAADFTAGLNALKKYDEPTMILFPDAVRLGSTDLHTLQALTLSQCALLQDRVAIFDLQENSSWEQGISDFRNQIGINNLKYGAAYTPHLNTTYSFGFSYKDLDIGGGKISDVLSGNSVANQLDDVHTLMSFQELLDTYEGDDSTIGSYASIPNATDQTDSTQVANELEARIEDLAEKLAEFLNPTGGSDSLSTSLYSADLLAKYNSLLADHKATLEGYVQQLLQLDADYYVPGTDNTADAWNPGAPPGIGATINAASFPSDYNTTVTASGTPSASPYGLQVSVSDLASQARTLLQTLFNNIHATLSTILSDLASDYGSDVEDWEDAATNLEESLKSNTVYGNILKAVQKQASIVPPSGAIAGIYTYVDNTRGVWKAPANVSLTAVSGLSETITASDQEDLNVDTTGGKSINAIRAFTGRGILVWGARTLAGNDNEWRYVSVRRFFNMAEESIKKSTAWAVFEPNDANTWTKVRSMIENYLIEKWREGALTGSKPDQAFFVNVGLGQTMTPQDVLEGRMIVEIGMAVVRPAEFIILRFSHKLQEA